MTNEALAPKYTHKSKMTPEQLEAHKEAARKYRREWARKNYDKRIAKMKHRMATDPEYAAKMKAQAAAANKRHRATGKKGYNESPEARERRLQRAREHKAKKYKEWRLANPIVPKEPKKDKPATNVVKKEYKRKPGRLLASMGWNGF